MWKFYDQQNGCRWRQGRKIHHTHKVKRSGESPPCNQSCCSDCSLHSLKMMHVTLLMQYCHFKVVLVVRPILTGTADFPSTWSTISKSDSKSWMGCQNPRRLLCLFTTVSVQFVSYTQCCPPFILKDGITNCNLSFLLEIKSQVHNQ